MALSKTKNLGRFFRVVFDWKFCKSIFLQKMQIISIIFQIECPFFLSHSQLHISVLLEINIQNQFHCHSMNQTLHLKTMKNRWKIPKYYEESVSFKVLNFRLWLNSSRKNIESSNFGRSSSILFFVWQTEILDHGLRDAYLKSLSFMISNKYLWNHDSIFQSVRK